MTRTAKVLLFCVNLVVAANFATAATTDNYVAAITGSGVQVNLTGAAGKPLANVSSTSDSLILSVGTATFNHRRLDGAGQNANGSGAMEVGVYDDNLANTTHTILQQVLKDFDTAITAGAALQNIFQTIDAPAGTDPVADSPTDTLAIFTDAFIGITGSSAADSLTFLLAATVTRDAEWDTQAEVEAIWGVTLATDAEVAAGYVPVTRTVSTTTPLAGGGALSANLTLSIANGAADGATLGAVAGAAADFNATSGVFSIDYTNGQKATTSVPGFLTAADWTTFNGKQASDAMLTALSALTTAQGDTIYFTGADAPALLTKDTNATRYLSNTGSSNNPAWAQVALATGVSGTLPIANFPDPEVPVDGTKNITGGLTASGDIAAANFNGGSLNNSSGNLALTSTGVLSLGASTTIQFDNNAKFISTALLQGETASRAVYLDASKILRSSSTVSDTELGYLDGVTSAIQTQLGALQPLDADLTDLAGVTAATGKFIYGNGTGDWVTSTLVVPNAATSGQMVYASTTNTWGGAANVTTNGTDLTLSDNALFGLGSGKGLIEFDDQSTDELNVLNAFLGINTQTPRRRLEISNAVAAGTDNFPLLVSNLTSSADARAGIAFHDNALTAIYGFGIQASNNGVDGAGNLMFGKIINDVWTELYRMNADGSFGIADTTPDAPLEVVGNVYISATAGGDGDRAKFQSGGLTLAGNLILPAVANGITFKEGTNARMGVATLVAGTATVSNTSVTANSRIFLTANTAGGTVGALYVSARTAGTSFVISSLSLVDTSTVAWIIYEPS